MSPALLLVGPLHWLILALLEPGLGDKAIAGVITSSPLGAGLFLILSLFFWLRQLGRNGVQRALMGFLILLSALDLYLYFLNPFWGGVALLSLLFALRTELSQTDESVRRYSTMELVQGHQHALLTAGLIGVFARDGYHVVLGPWGDWVLVGCALGSFSLGVWLDWRQAVLERAQIFIWILRVVAVLALVSTLGWDWIGLLLVPDFLVTAVSLWRGPLGELIRTDSFENPPVVILFGFVSMIALGTCLLGLPASSASGNSVGFMSAFFTSTSAVCVTGLSVLDVGKELSFFGQTVLLGLIQLGGLGIITLSVFVAVLLGARMGLQQTWAFAELSEQLSPNSMRRLVKEIVFFTLAAEVLGALVLTYAVMGEEGHFGEAIWFGVFHSVSAFCNAGFALQSDSLISFRDNISVLGPIAALVVLGGIGFVPLSVIASRLVGQRHSLNLHTKVALIGTALFLFLGALGFSLLQYAGPENPVSPGDALFWSVTLRTAGFNQIPMDSLNPAATLWSMALMMIGGCPGGTAGGVKVTTVLLLFLAVRGLLRDEYDLQFLHRTVPRRTVIRALVVVVLSVAFVFLGFLALLATQRGFSFMALGFETVSAFGTVGLSLDITSKLDAFGITIIAALMFIGRVGPLALAYGLGRSEKLPWEGAKEDIHVG